MGNILKHDFYNLKLSMVITHQISMPSMWHMLLGLSTSWYSVAVC